MTNPTPPSPAAQAVLDAASDVYWDWTNMEPAASHVIAAAALRAAADQVMPEEQLYGGNQRWMFERDARQVCRKKFLAIAAELEALSNN